MDSNNLCKAPTEALIYMSRKSSFKTFQTMTDEKYCIKHVAPVSTMDNIKSLGLISKEPLTIIFIAFFTVAEQSSPLDHCVT